MKATVADIIRIMEDIAPADLAEDWDNSGLQVGERSWSVKNIWTALDPEPGVVAAACRNKIDLLITHHPLIFQPLKTVDFGTSLGNIIRMAVAHKMAIFTAHTNLDKARNGLNDILAQKLGLINIRMLCAAADRKIYKLVMQGTEKSLEKIFSTLVEAGSTTAYDDVWGLSYPAREIFRNGEKVTFEKKHNSAGRSNEIRIEATLRKGNLQKVIQKIRTFHSYDAVSCDIYPLYAPDIRHGMGRVGELTKTETLESFAESIGKKLGITAIRAAGDPRLMIDRAVVCSGSGSGLLSHFMASGAQVYISGDLKYHDAKQVQDAGLAVIDIGHFASEVIIVEELKNQLIEILAKKKINAGVEACKMEKDPFWRPGRIEKNG